MEHTNFCRQVLKEWSDVDFNTDHPFVRVYEGAIRGIKAAEKFILPIDGEFLDDVDLRALDSIPLRLPFPVCALEYFASKTVEEDKFQSKKRIALASEVPGGIQVMPIYSTEGAGGKIPLKWVAIPPVLVPSSSYLRRDLRNEFGPAIMADRYRLKVGPEFPPFPDSDYFSEMRAVLGLINALACSNVHIARSKTEKQPSKKGALLFDEYHYLTIDVSKQDGIGFERPHGSPREHLRRGHIRKLPEKKIWINSHVVNAGRGGRITKDYVLK